MVTGIALNKLHNENTLQTEDDGKVYVKNNNQWNEISTNFYKDITLPAINNYSTGDYLVLYDKIYNNLLYSEDFNNFKWQNNYVDIIGKVPTISYPYSPMTSINAINRKVNNVEVASQHFLSQFIPIELDTEYTFSIYVKAGTYSNIQLSIYNGDETIGAEYSVFILNNHASLRTINPNNITVTNYSKEIIENQYAKITLSVIIPTANFLNLKIGMLNDLGQNTFLAPSGTEGLYINAAQLSKGRFKSYVRTYSSFAYKLSYSGLYTLFDNYWKLTNNTVYYTPTLADINLGNNGDINVVCQSLTFNSCTRLGNIGIEPFTTINLDGSITYKADENTYLLRVDDVNKRLLTINRNNNKKMLRAILLGNKIYNTYWKRDSIDGVSFDMVMNTAGNYNFWR